MLATISIFVAPGFLLSELLIRGQLRDPIERIGVAIGTSFAVLPVLLLLITAGGMHFSTEAIIASALLLSSGLLLSGIRFRSSLHLGDLHIAGFFLIFTVSLLVRFVVIKDLWVPMWGDSYQHTLITQLIQDHGSVPTNYYPYAELNRFTYHFGFHTITAFFATIAGIEPFRATLIVGQLINACATFSAYIFTLTILEDRRAALVSALLVGLLFAMPAYFVNWGRYTQLTGLVLLPIVFDITKRFFESARTEGGLWLLACILIAGLILTHYAITIFFALLLFAYLLIYQSPRMSDTQHLNKLIERSVLLLFGTLFLILPWGLQLVTSERFGSAGIIGTRTTMQISTSAQKEVAQIGRSLEVRFRDNYHLLFLTVIGLLWGISQRSRAILLVSVWVGFLFALPLIARIVTPTSSIGSILSNIDVDNVVISLFLPFAVVISMIVCTCYSHIGTTKTHFGRWLTVLFFGVLIFSSVVGTINLANILNRDLELVVPEDIPAMRWVENNTPSSAKFLTNMYFWNGNTVMGYDAGYWLPILAKRSTLVPPLLYTSENMERKKVLRLRQIAQSVLDGTITNEDQLCRLRNDGVNYIFVGSRPRNILTRDRLLVTPNLEEIYHNGNTAVFKINGCVQNFNDEGEKKLFKSKTRVL